MHGCVQVCAGVCWCVWVCAGVLGCAQVCLGVRGCAWSCTGARKCTYMYVGVIGWVWYARVCMGVCGSVRKCEGVCKCVCWMNFQNIFWRLESIHQRTLIRILYEFLFETFASSCRVCRSSLLEASILTISGLICSIQFKAPVQTQKTNSKPVRRRKRYSVIIF